MPPLSSDGGFAASELFRYARVRPPRVLDLGRRAARLPEAKEVLERSEEERRVWAQEFLDGERRVRSAADLRFRYFRYLRVKAPPRDRLPSAADIKDAAKFDGNTVRADEAYRQDRERLLLTVLALRLRGAPEADAHELRAVAHLLDFVEVFPDLKRVRVREPYAKPVLERAKLRTPQGPKPSETEGASAPVENEGPEPRAVAEGLQVLWRARNQSLGEARESYEIQLREIVRSRPELPPRVDPATIRMAQTPHQGPRLESSTTSEGPSSTKQDRLEAQATARARAKAHAAALRERTAAIRKLRTTYSDTRASLSLERVLSTPASTLATHIPGRTEDDIAALMKLVLDFIGKHGIPITRFCEAYETAVAKADALGIPSPVEEEVRGCYGAHPNLVFADTVRILGEADLIRVDETFVRYSAGEISYVENVLAGEVRKRQVKTTRYAETLTETQTEESTETSEESSASTKQELRSQVETELQTRLQSDISASANASGGGTIGVVEVQGGGAVDASLGVGLDTSLNTANESRFSQEIVSKALQRTRSVVRERQLSRSYSLDETLNLHKIANDRDGAASFNGVYCFLDKHVAITETIYGRRLFLLANVYAPGRSLLCARLQRLRYALEDVGIKPTFDITPADITPANYMALAGRFKAQAVEPPPPPIVTLGRTYKTDHTNTNSESEPFSGRKIAGLAVPFFEQYKRFLIVENVKLPDGYEVMEVSVNVNHGANGLSIPADLPLRGGAALVGAGPLMVAYAGYGPFLLPVWMWYVGFLASPLLHYNCDSSNVTVAIGTESQKSEYYFFDPEVLIPELIQLLETIGGAVPNVLAQVQAGLGPLMAELATRAAEVPGEAAAAVNAAATAFVNALKEILEDLAAVRPVDALNKLANLGFQVTNNQLANFEDAMGELFEPFRGFIQGAIDALHGEIGAAIADFIAYIVELGQSSQVLAFSGAQGTRGELPVSFNTVAVKPGITINLSACLRRTDEALARWKLETFANFYRAHLQLVADWESRTFMANDRVNRLAKPSALLRAEEHAAIKERVLHTLNNVPGPNDAVFTLERMNLLEHALDWPNMTYRVFNYGPNADEIRMEKAGVFQGVDARRRAFTTGLWAQIMIPVSGNPHHVGQVIRYFEDETIDFEGELQNEELVALYRDFVLGMEEEPTEVLPPRFEVVPTEFVVLKTPDLDTSLPVNPLFAEDA